MEDRPGLARLPALALLAAALLALVLVAWWRIPWDWVPGGRLTPLPAEELFTGEEVARAEAFAGRARLIGLSSYAVSLLVALVLGLTPAGARLVRRLPLGRLWWLRVPAGTSAVLLVGVLVTLPLDAMHRRHLLDFGLTEQAWPAWLRDRVTGWLVDSVLVGLLLLVLVASARRFPRWWYAVAAGGAAALTAAGSYLYPVLVEPLFNDFSPLPDGEARAAVLALAEAEGVEVGEVLVADASRRTTTLNAYVSGFGDTRRVVVYDTLLESADTAELEVVVAHELAHARHDDVAVGTALGMLGAVGGVAALALLLDRPRLLRRAGVRGPGDPAVLALVLALGTVGQAVAEPLVNTVSRAVEIRADRVSLTFTGADDAFVGIQRRLALRSLSDPTPPVLLHRWFGSHPTVLQRAGLPSSWDEAPR